MFIEKLSSVHEYMPCVISKQTCKPMDSDFKNKTKTN